MVAVTSETVIVTWEPSSIRAPDLRGSRIVRDDGVDLQARFLQRVRGGENVAVDDARYTHRCRARELHVREPSGGGEHERRGRDRGDVLHPPTTLALRPEMERAPRRAHRALVLALRLRCRGHDRAGSSDDDRHRRRRCSRRRDDDGRGCG